MPGLPLGAAQQHDVPAEQLTYERITGIEFIELDANLPYPRSAAYRRSASGADMLVRAHAPEIEQVQLSEEQARAYIDALVAAGLFSWQRVYRPVQGTFVNSSTQWRLKVEFSAASGAGRKLARKPRPFESEGENVFPDSYEQVVAALMAPGAQAGLADKPDTEA